MLQSPSFYLDLRKRYAGLNCVTRLRRLSFIARNVRTDPRKDKRIARTDGGPRVLSVTCGRLLCKNAN